MAEGLENCPVRGVIAQIGDKWSVLAILHLGHGGLRFAELRRAMGDDISHRVLTQVLRKLEREGLVARTVTPAAPPRVDYALTPLGASLMPHLRALAGWAKENRPAIEAARRRFAGTDPA
ncbi:MAG TPA: helix-turn-helix domain-containing protein [Alphaproteobacteria bacterium]|nr:helix-turn-helix domain-containing protein [Alphaproteobacteria bacterium]